MVPKKASINLARPKNQTVENTISQADSYMNREANDVDKLTKTDAEIVCKKNGVLIFGNCRFANRNKTGNVYWVNPPINYLAKDWFLLLNDHRKKQLHVFKVPANSISASKVKLRNDKPHQIDLQIYCDDKSFEDSRSKIEFANWLIKTIEY